MSLGEEEEAVGGNQELLHWSGGVSGVTSNERPSGMLWERLRLSQHKEEAL